MSEYLRPLDPQTQLEMEREALEAWKHLMPTEEVERHEKIIEKLEIESLQK